MTCLTLFGSNPDKASNIAVEPTPNSFRSYVAPAIGRGSPLAFCRQMIARRDVGSLAT